MTRVYGWLEGNDEPDDEEERGGWERKVSVGHQAVGSTAWVHSRGADQGAMILAHRKR